ncbi:hypothetical protein ARMGADRAFT_1039202 [Armillaria gallica]|uniref:Uncharacterized protein n=1 Tax=Armillaria gallica TaxID=47427 RepID=A0A2H3CEV1_ARMGA|nr:hypothetical protein ARMGADRAFT_1039202 [Armillaria gallica]
MPFKKESTPTTKDHNIMVEMMGTALQAVSAKTTLRVPPASLDQPFNVERGHYLVWELCELNFRLELLALDAYLTRLVQSSTQDDPDFQLQHQNTILKLFPEKSIVPSSASRPSSCRLASSVWQDRCGALKFFKDIMQQWVVPLPQKATGNISRSTNDSLVFFFSYATCLFPSDYLKNNVKRCSYCGNAFKSREFTNHKIACAQRYEDEKCAALFEAWYREWIQARHLTDPLPPINVPFCSGTPPESEEPTCSHVQFKHLWERGIPTTSNIFWEVQSALPVDGKPICYVIYADKTHLSSFETVQGYPVIVRLGNLPAHIHNRQGVGGGRVIGWLPIVADEPKHHSKSYYADFKRAIWHNTFEIILSSIKDKSKPGAWMQPPGSDAAPWHIFPTIMILSADYEEQCIMSLI